MLGVGTSASLGIVTGEVVLSSEMVAERSRSGPVILMKEILTPDDISGVGRSEGIITARGNRMAHAVVVARQLNIACIVNVPELKIDMENRTFMMDGKKFHEGTTLTMDSGNGRLYEGKVRVIDERPLELLGRSTSGERGANGTRPMFRSTDNINSPIGWNENCI